MEKLKTIYVMDEYEPIMEHKGQSYMNSIIKKTQWINDIDDDINNFYYVCNKDKCIDEFVYYNEKQKHNEEHHTDKCCVIL
jgi:hypothetical protein